MLNDRWTEWRYIPFNKRELAEDVNKSFSNVVSCGQVERSNMAAIRKNEARAEGAVVAQKKLNKNSFFRKKPFFGS